MMKLFRIKLSILRKKRQKVLKVMEILCDWNPYLKPFEAAGSFNAIEAFRMDP